MNANIMIKIGEANTTIEGNPIELKGIELSYQIDANAQEMSVSGGILNNVYDKIQEMAKSFNTPTPAPTPTITPTKSNTSFCEIQNEEKPEKASQKWDLPAVWGVMMSTLPEGFDKSGVGTYTYVHTRENDLGKTEKTTIKISFKDESIDMNVRLGDTSAFFYLYEEGEKSWVIGINPTLIDELMDELPDGVREFVRTFVKKVLNK